MMMLWVLVAVVGGILSVMGFVRLVRRFRQGAIRGRYLLAFGVGFVALVSFALLDALRPAVVSGPVTLAMLLPAVVAIVVIVREHQRAAAIDDSTR
jgi:hypothetical protein